MKNRLIVPDGEHSPLGPSSAKRWINCPGSVRASEGVLKKSSIYANKGTAAHYVSELVRSRGVPASTYLGYEVWVVRDGDKAVIPVDQAMVDSIQEFVDRASEFEGDPFYEIRVDYEEIVLGGFGTLDDLRVSFDGKKCRIMDFKDGEGVQVFAKKNEQLMLYAIGFMITFGWLYPNIEEFELCIAQPRLDHFDSWPISFDDLCAWGDSVAKPAALVALGVNAPFKAGEWCQFCPIKHTCKTRAEFALTQVVGDFGGFENLDESPKIAQVLDKAMPLPSEQAGTLIEGEPFLGNEHVATLLRCLPFIKAWCADLQAYATREVQQGRAVGDWKLVAGRSKRLWDAEESAVEDALRDEGLTEEQIYTKKLITPPKAEKLVGKKKFKPEGSMAKYVHKPPGKPTLVPGEDKRPALTPDALAQFQDLGEEPSDDDEE